MSFEPVRALLNPTFDSYKLSSSQLSLTATDLPPISDRSDPIRDAQLSWKVARSRARWNGLVANESAPEVAWIESARSEVWHATRDQDHWTPRKLFDFPLYASTSASSAEVPTLSSCGPSRYAVADGQGALHLISASGHHLSAAYLCIDDTPRPFRLHACNARSATALLSFNVPREGLTQGAAAFDIVVVRLPRQGELDHGPLELIERWRGDDIPSLAFCLDGAVWVVGADSPFRSITDAKRTATQPGSVPTQPASSPQYRWTQTSDSVDIDIPHLPQTLKSVDFKVAFSPHHISLLIAHRGAPRFPHRQLWAPVDAGACTWTWEPSEELLSVHLEKRDVGTRWSTLFAAVPDEGEVLEDVSEQQLTAISSSLERFTADGDDVTAFETRAGLLGEEGEEVDDEDASDSTIFTLLSDGTTGDAVTVISEPLPRCGRPSDPSVLIKRLYDGLLYIPSLGADGALAWTHTTTFPALAYVLASKRSLRFRFHLSSDVALALDGGGLPASSGAAGSSAYAYWPPAPGQRQKTAMQAVMSLSGSVVRGAVALDEDSVAVLCEGQLKVLSGFAT